MSTYKLEIGTSSVQGNALNFYKDGEFVTSVTGGSALLTDGVLSFSGYSFGSAVTNSWGAYPVSGTVDTDAGTCTLTLSDNSVLYGTAAAGNGFYYTLSDLTEEESSSSSSSSAAAGFYKWTADVLTSHNKRINQDVCFRAKIVDNASGAAISPALVTGAKFSAFRIADDGTRSAVTGFVNLTVPSSAFSAAVGADGFNFRYTPDQSSVSMLAVAGMYELVVSITVDGGNPFDMFSEILTVR